MTDYFYITTPIYYVNDVPHIGHAYTTIAADFIARFHRLDEKEVKFLTGTDEHGQKVAKAAANQGVTPRELVDKVSVNFRDLVTAMNCSPDRFIRTTEPQHYAAAQALWRKLVARGYIYKSTYSGWYSMRDEAYYQPDEIVDGKAPTGAPVEWIEESSYFFKLSDFQQPLLDYYQANPDFIVPLSRRNEVVSFVAGGLKDLSISRATLKWGVPVPDDEEHVMYVWLDALTNYITALGYPNWEENAQALWCNVCHIIGKDILRFHAVYWPAFLMAADLPPPARIFAHGWWTNEGQKISKSVGNVIDPLQLLEEYDVDVLRYFLLRNVPFGQDGDFSKRLLQERRDKELANDLGNLAQRVLSFVVTHCGGRVPETFALAPSDKELIALGENLLARLRQAIQEQALHRYLELVWELITSANRYIDHEKPWALRKEDPARMQTVISLLCQTIYRIAIALLPALPTTSQKLLQQLGFQAEIPNFSSFLKSSIIVGQQLGAVTPLFPRA